MALSGLGPVHTPPDRTMHFFKQFLMVLFTRSTPPLVCGVYGVECRIITLNVFKSSLYAAELNSLSDCRMTGLPSLMNRSSSFLMKPATWSNVRPSLLFCFRLCRGMVHRYFETCRSPLTYRYWWFRPTSLGISMKSICQICIGRRARMLFDTCLVFFAAVVEGGVDPKIVVCLGWWYPRTGAEAERTWHLDPEIPLARIFVDEPNDLHDVFLGHDTEQLGPIRISNHHIKRLAISARVVLRW